MSKQRSAKGEIVDFDLMKIKQEIGTAQKPIKVQAREEFIERKLRRRLRKAKPEVSVVVESDEVEADKAEEAPKKVQPKTTRKLKKKQDQG